MEFKQTKRKALNYEIATQNLFYWFYHASETNQL